MISNINPDVGFGDNREPGPEVVTEVLPGILYQSGRIDHFADIGHGVEVVVDLTGSGLEPIGAPEEPGFLYVHWPIRDETDGVKLPPGPVLRAMGEFIADLLQAGKVVLVHCKGGRNRSSLVLVMALMAFLGIGSAEGIAMVKEARRGTFTNHVFEDWLMVVEG